MAATKRKRHPLCKLLSLREEFSKQRISQGGKKLTLREVARSVKYRHKNGRELKMSSTGVWCVEHGGEVTLSVARALAGFYGKSVCEVWPDVT